MGGTRKKWVDSWESHLPEPLRDSPDKKPASDHQSTLETTHIPQPPSDTPLTKENTTPSDATATKVSKQSLRGTAAHSQAVDKEPDQQQCTADNTPSHMHSTLMGSQKAINANERSSTVPKKEGIIEATPMAKTRPVMTPSHSVANSFISPHYSPVSVKDVRGQEPKNAIDMHNWNETRRPRQRRDWDSDSICSSVWTELNDKVTFTDAGTTLHEHTTAWLSRVPLVEKNLLPVTNDSVCENQVIDANTGELMEPIEAPYTKTRREIDRSRRNLHDKLCIQTSAHSSEERLRDIRRRDEERREKEKRIEHARQVRAQEDAQAKKKNPFLCREPAHIRPAQLDDMGDICRIYAEEVCNGWRALDQVPLGIESFQEHFRLCRKDNIPFLVAMSGYRNPHIPVTEQKHRVLGFAFLDIASRGLFGSAESNGKHSGRLYFMVDSRVRYNRIATALLDRMLIITTRGYLANESSYQWLNPDNDPAYNAEGRTPRQWRTLQLEIYLKNLGTEAETKNGQEYGWIRDWLQVEFQFFESSFTSNYGFADRRGDTTLDRLVLERRCS
ncbi:hypothetical protein PFICI_11678 [Pestalotiopsis fici W106-1]|uniref:N-acetyltransferase domain-containing protein n=1 Tax=Pestalotiopsis fici (strain W106-1 / CGMCC3.15140) TaxID=1229662 RepID=W3WTY1_PESFW|nr:uncharacterized protein PFICI_11678 [Pestalotiopsis fici W106-1]ETS76291.1 hypothetical protein PFICI_11678 [Pestalotiopsis fici W106-1]